MFEKNDLSTRNEINENLDKNKELMDEGEVDLDKAASDIEIVRQTLEELDFSGTVEGSEEIKESIDNAETTSVDVFDQHDEELDEFQEENESIEQENQERENLTESDLGKVSDASAKIEANETNNELLKAKDAALQDIDFLKEVIDRARAARDHSEEVQKEQKDRIQRSK